MFEVGDIVVYVGEATELVGQLCKITEVKTIKGKLYYSTDLVTPFARGNGFTTGLGGPSRIFQTPKTEIIWEV